MSRKDYVAFAKEIAAIEDRAVAATCAALVARVAAADNYRFDTQRFFAACGL